MSVFLVFCLLATTAHSQSLDFAKLDAYVEKSMEQWQVPGLSLAIVKDGEVAYAKGYGKRRVGKRDGVDENTIFPIGSNTKAFTTAVLSMLVDQGKLNWDDPVQKYLPQFQLYDPYVTREMTVLDLVTHRSGLATFSGDHLVFGSNYTREEIVHRIRYLKPVSSFRSRYGYQNLMYVTAGEIIPAVTGESWDDAVENRIFKPLGMRSSSTSVTQLPERGNVAGGHWDVDGEIQEVELWNIDGGGPAGSINSSAADMAKWLLLQLGSGTIGEDSLYSKAAAAQMWRGQTVVGNATYAMGWKISHSRGKKFIRHGGAVVGAMSQVVLLPEEDLGFVVLTNSMSALPDTVLAWILDAYAGDEETDYSTQFKEGFDAYASRINEADTELDESRQKGTTPSLRLDGYVGRYNDEMYGDLEISVRDEALYLAMLPSATFKGALKHWHYNTFMLEWEEPVLPRGFVTFNLDMHGAVRDITIDVPHFPDLLFGELLFRPKDD